MKMIVHQIASAYLQAICLLEELIVGLCHDSEHALLINSTEMGVFNCAFGGLAAAHRALLLRWSAAILALYVSCRPSLRRVR